MEFSAITTAITNVGSVLTTVVSTIADNPLLMVFVGASVVTVGIKVFKKLKRGAN